MPENSNSQQTSAQQDSNASCGSGLDTSRPWEYQRPMFSPWFGLGDSPKSVSKSMPDMSAYVSEANKPNLSSTSSTISSDAAPNFTSAQLKQNESYPVFNGFTVGMHKGPSMAETRAPSSDLGGPMRPVDSSESLIGQAVQYLRNRFE